MTTKFRHVSDWGESRFSANLGVNLVQFVNQAYLNIGAFQNVTLNQSGAYDGIMSTLQPIADPRYEDSTIWQTFRKNWVYESVDYEYQPISISGIYIDGVFQPSTGIGPYSYKLDYLNGLVIFDSGISLNSSVEMEYSYKLVSVSDDRTDWFHQIQYDSQRADSEHFGQYGSGIYNVLAQNRIQLPAIICQPFADVQLEGRQLGAHNVRYQSVIFHIIAENSWDKRTIVDDLINQKDVRLFFFDYDKVLQSGVFPLFIDGSINASGLSYADLIAEGNGYRYRDGFIENVAAEDFGNTMPQVAIVRWWLGIYI